MNSCSHGLPRSAAQIGGTRQTNGRTPDGETNLMPNGPEINSAGEGLSACTEFRPSRHRFHPYHQENF